jgi:hypothetical protein
MPLGPSRYSSPPPNHGPFQSHEPPGAYRPPYGTPPPFYPIQIGRGVSLAFSLYRFAWRQLVLISVITTVPVALLTAAAAAIEYGPLSAWEQAMLANALRGGNAAQMWSTYPWDAVGLSVLATIVVGPVALIGGAALTHAIATALGGSRPNVRASFRAALARWRDLLVAFLVLMGTGVGIAIVGIAFPMLSALGPGGIGLNGLTLFATLIFFVAVAFGVAYVEIRLVFTVQALILEREPAIGAMRRSWSIASGSMLRIIGWAAMFALIVGLIGLLLEIVAGIAAFVIAPPSVSVVSMSLSPTFMFVFTFLIAALSAIVAPIAAIGLTLLYFDIRSRRGESVPEPGRSPA